MSKRNSQEAKRTARERLRLERELQARRAKVKRQAIVAVSIVAVLAITGGISYAVVQNSRPTKWEEAADAKGTPDAKVTAPAHTSGRNGTTVLIGDSTSKNTVHLYEDPRCPGCALFEQSIGTAVNKGMEDGTYKLSFTFGTFLDSKLGGEGSKNALSALGAALDVSTDAFLEYKSALYSAEYHPEESADEFAEDSYLIKVANTVDALKNNKKFQDAVEKGTYDAWAMKMSGSFDDTKGIQSTPTIRINDRTIEIPSLVAQWETALKDAGVSK